MKLFTYRTFEHRDKPFPCPEVWEMTVVYLFGLIPWKKTKKKLK